MASDRKIEDIYPRAPRYTIELGDQQIVRFAKSPKGAKAMHTRIIDLSESGMAFLTPYNAAPEVSEKIKVEFTAPNSDPIACFANVARIQIHKTYSHDQKPQSFKMVAVEFENLHAKQRKMLADGLVAQFKKKRAQFQRQQMLLKLKWTAHLVASKIADLTAKLSKKPSADTDKSIEPR